MSRAKAGGRDELARAGLGLAYSAGLGALVGLGGGSASVPSSGAGPATAPPPGRDDGEIVHVLIRVTFAPRPGDEARVRSISALAELPSLQLPIPACS